MICIEATAKVYVILDHPPYLCLLMSITFSTCFEYAQVFLLTHVYHILDMFLVLLYFCLLMSITFSVCCQYACISAYSCLSHSQYVASTLVFLLTHVYHILSMLPVRLYFCLLMSITFSICFQYSCISAYSCLSHSQYVASTLVFLLTHVYHILSMLPVCLYFCLLMSITFSVSFQYACIPAYSCLSHSQYVASTLVFLLTHVYHILSMLPVRLYFCLLMSITFSICCQYACISAYSCLSHSQYVASTLVFLLTHVYHILNMLLVRLYFCLLVFITFSICCQYACISAYSCLSHSQYVASMLVFLLTHVYHILNMLLVRLYVFLLMSIIFSVCCQYACISAYSCLSHSQYVASTLVFLLTHVYHILNMLLVRLYFCLLVFITFSICCQYACILLTHVYHILSMLPVCLYFCLLMSITFSVCCQYACISSYSCLSHSQYVAVCLYFCLLMSITFSICCSMLVFLLTHVYHILDMLQYACISAYSCLSHSQYVASTLVFLLTHVYHILNMLQYACISAYSYLSHSQYVASTLVFLLTHVYHILSMLPVRLYFCLLVFIYFSVCCQYACISSYSCLSHSQYVASTLVFLLTHVYHILSMLPERLYFCLLMSITFSVCCQYACISAYSCLSHS